MLEVIPVLVLVVMASSSVGSSLAELIFSADFREAVFRSALYVVLTVPAQIVLGVASAALVHKASHRARVLSTVLFLPYAVPSVVAVVAWEFLIRDHGVLAVALHSLTGAATTDYMGKWLWATLAIVSIWQFYPFVFVTVLARARRIPNGLYHTAAVDGAGPLEAFRFVTWPQIKATVLVALVLRIAFMFTKFDTVWILGGSSASEAARLVPVFIYDKAINFATQGDAARAALLVASAVAALLLIVSSRIKDENWA